MLKKKQNTKKNHQKQGSSFIEIEIKQYIISTVVKFIYKLDTLDHKYFSLVTDWCNSNFNKVVTIYWFF